MPSPEYTVTDNSYFTVYIADIDKCNAFGRWTASEMIQILATRAKPPGVEIDIPTEDKRKVEAYLRANFNPPAEEAEFRDAIFESLVKLDPDEGLKINEKFLKAVCFMTLGTEGRQHASQFYADMLEMVQGALDESQTRHQIVADLLHETDPDEE